MARHGIVRKPAAIAASIGMGALLLVGCGTHDLPDARIFAGNGTTQASMTVACEPNQRAIVRQVVVNGVMSPQVECTSALEEYQAVAPATMPVNYAVPAPYRNTSYVREAQEPVHQTVYRRAAPRIVHNSRPWQQSALIIGSSAGVGAGVGAAVGGKKGALIGAALGGGGATIWDQLTRRRR